MRLPIGRLAPRVLILIFAVEAALRFLPVRMVAYRGWEATRAFLHGSFFLPDQRYENPRAYGDLSNAGNVPQWREYRHDVFTTDRRGYRNPPGLLDGRRPAAVLFGDSFSGGAANADDETLSAMLTARIGAPVYNAAARPNLDLEDWLELADDVGLERGWVIYQHVPRSGRLAASRRKSLSTRVQSAIRKATPETWGFIRWAWSQPASVSPLQIWLSRPLRRIEDGEILPNRYLKGIAPRRLADGQQLLFQPEPPALSPEEAERDADAWHRLFEERAVQLSKHGHRLMVVLLPEKLTVYGPLLEQPTSSTEPIVASLARLEAELRRSGVAVVNLTPIYRAEAKERLGKGETIFWRDDTHWNTAGVRLAAEAVAREMKK